MEPHAVNANNDIHLEKPPYNIEVDASSVADSDVAALARLGKRPVLKVYPGRRIFIELFKRSSLTTVATIYLHVHSWVYLYNLDHMGSRANVRYSALEKTFQ